MKIVLGNKRYSSWSLRGWLAAKQSGQPFEEVVVRLYHEDWDARKADTSLTPSGLVPVLWDGDIAVWDSLAIIDWLADRFGQAAYWPIDGAARALARSMAAEMHSGFTALRTQCPVDVAAHYPSYRLEADTEKDVARVEALWNEARGRHGRGGPYLFGAFGAADIMYAPVALRFRSYGIEPGGDAAAYLSAMLQQPWIEEWVAAGKAEPADWAIDKYAEHAAQYAG